MPCSKRLPVVRDAFSEALGAQNRLLWYRRDIRYRKRPPTVRGCIFRAHNKKRDAEKLHPHNQFTQTIKPQLFDFDTTRSRNFLLLNTLRQRNVKHTVHHLSLNGIKVNVFRKSKALMV